MSFSAAGTYQLALTADDGDLAGSATVTIVVQPPPTDEPRTASVEFQGSLATRRPVLAFTMTVSDGPAAASLTFGNSPGGKSSSAAEMTLTLTQEPGASLPRRPDCRA